MSSVNLIQFSEPRLQPVNAGPAPEGDPFGDLLESVTAQRRADAEPRSRHTPREEPAAPRQRTDMRAEALDRNDVCEAKPCERRPAASADESGDEAPELAASEGDDEVSETETDQQEAVAPEAQAAAGEADAETIVGSEEIPQAPVAAVDDAEDGEAENETPSAVASPQIVPEDAADATAKLANAVEATQASVSAVPSESAGESATEPEGAMNAGAKPAASVPVVAEDGAAPIMTAEPAPAAPVPQAKAEQAAVPAAAAQAAEAVDADRPVNLPAQPPAPRTGPQTAETPQFQQALQAAAPDADQPSTPFQGDADGQPAQQQSAQASQTKPQDVKPAAQTEAVKPAQPQIDVAAPKSQPDALPEPVRALASTLNPASVNAAHLRAASLNDRAPVPLTGTALAAEIVSRVKDGLRRFDIRLDPPELGRIDVRMEVDRTGNVKTHMTVERPETLELVQRESRGLERALQQAGLKTDGSGLEFSLRSHADHPQSDGQPGRQGREPDFFGDDGGERIEAVIEGYRSSALARGGVDIRI